eukprot:2816981-Pyramimonas_sp.AAC.1
MASLVLASAVAVWTHSSCHFGYVAGVLQHGSTCGGVGFDPAHAAHSTDLQKLCCFPCLVQSFLLWASRKHRWRRR